METEEITQTTNETQKLTEELLKEKLKELELAFEPFKKELGFYAVSISLQGGFNSIITNTANSMGYTSSIRPNGFLYLEKDGIWITLTE